MKSALDHLGMDPLGSRLVDNDGRWVFVEEQMRIGRVETRQSNEEPFSERPVL